MLRRFPSYAPLRASLLAFAFLLLPAALLAGATAAQAQEPEITVYHSLDGSDPRPEYPPGCTGGTGPGGGGTGGWIIVVGDIDAGNNPTFYTNLLEGDTEVLAGRGLTASNAAVVAHYQSLAPGVTTTVTNDTITTAALTNKDLLIFNQPNYDLTMVYTAPELTAIADFVAGGGNVLLVAESNFHHTNFNDFLIGIGATALRYTTEPRVVGGATVVTGAPFTAGVTSFNQGAYNVLSGGEPIVIESAGDMRTIVAAEQLGDAGPPTPECVLGGDSYEELSLWIAGNGSDSTDPTKTCILDEVDADGDEICGAKLRFQLSGIGHFRKFVPDGDYMDTLVLGEPCLPEEGLGCIFETNPPVTSLEMNFVRGGMPLSAAPRRLGSLIVNSTGLVKGTNSTLVNVFGSAADAQLHLVEFGTLPPHIIVADSDAIAVPEPGQLLQLVSGLFGLAGLQRLRRRH